MQICGILDEMGVFGDFLDNFYVIQMKNDEKLQKNDEKLHKSFIR